MIIGSVLVFSIHDLSIYISKSLYFESFWNVFKDVFLSDGIETSNSRHVLDFLSRITMSGRLVFVKLTHFIVYVLGHFVVPF